MSLSDDQIATITRWVDLGAPQGDPKDMPAPKQWPKANEWQAAKEIGTQPDLIIEATSYTMPGKSQDVWWRPVADIPVTEPRWVRAVEVRPTTAQARKTIHHAVAYLVQNDDDAPTAGSTNDADRQGVLMEWAIGKSYDISIPTRQAAAGIEDFLGCAHSRRRRRDSLGRPAGTVAVSQRAGAEVSHAPDGVPGKTGPNLDLPPTRSSKARASRTQTGGHAENIQPHMHLRGKAMALSDSAGRYESDGQLRRQLQLQLDDELHL
jgi:hypothetical protein